MPPCENILTTTAPDWSQQTEELHCPLCDYNLRGLSEPRCPECGYSFEWADLTDPAKKKHPSLFEHHPNRNLWSLKWTALGQLLPRRFWKGVKPEMPSNRRRLIVYWGIICAAWLVWLLMEIPVGEIGATMYQYSRREEMRGYLATPRGATYRATVIVRHGSVEAFLDQSYPTPMRWDYWKQAPSRLWWRARSVIPQSWRSSVPIVFLGLPWLTLLTTGLFRASMRQARILPIHVLRVLIYSSDMVMILLALSIGLAMAEMAEGMTRYQASNSPYVRTEAIAVAFLMPIFAYRLFSGFSMYLRFRHAAATVIATQLIAFLIFLCIAAWIPPITEQLTVQWLGFQRFLRW